MKTKREAGPKWGPGKHVNVVTSTMCFTNGGTCFYDCVENGLDKETREEAANAVQLRDAGMTCIRAMAKVTARNGYIWERFWRLRTQNLLMDLGTADEDERKSIMTPKFQTQTPGWLMIPSSTMANMRKPTGLGRQEETDRNQGSILYWFTYWPFCQSTVIDFPINTWLFH